MLSPLHEASHDLEPNSTEPTANLNTDTIDYQRRQAVLESYGLLDTEPEAVFDKITRLATDVFDVPVALISLMDYEKNRQWFKSCHGIDTRQSDLNTSFCLHAVINDSTLVVPNTLQDAAFKDYSMVQDEPNRTCVFMRVLLCARQRASPLVHWHSLILYPVKPCLIPR